jgi:hypothetical protein
VPTLTPTPAPTATAITPLAPAPVPTRAPAPTPTPLAQISSGVAPTVSALTIACSAPGASLPLHNNSASMQAFTFAVPQGVVVNGWTGRVSGAVSPGQTMVFHVWHVSGARGAGVPLTVSSAAHSYTVRLYLQPC